MRLFPVKTQSREIFQRDGEYSQHCIAPRWQRLSQVQQASL